MKKLLFVLVMAGFFINCSAEKVGEQYGTELTLTEVTPISTLLENPADFEGKRVLIEGRIMEVCEMQGCWMDIAGDKELTQLRVKVDDGVITFPMTASGKTAQAEGIFTILTQNVEQQIETGNKHAEETGEEFNPATITGPKTFYQLKTDGAVIQ